MAPLLSSRRRNRVVFFFFLFTAIAALAQNADWSKPFPAHRVIGPVHYVGTADLACFLITSAKGHILINTGLADSGGQIRRSIENLGFKVTDVRILLTNQ